jgi:ABC-2 type transport system permease protein
MSALTAATRDLFGNPNPYAEGGIPADHPEALTLAWVAAIMVVFVPLAIHRYRSMSR